MKRLYSIAAILVCALAFSTVVSATTHQSVAPVVQIANAQEVADQVANEGGEIADTVADHGEDVADTVADHGEAIADKVAAHGEAVDEAIAEAEHAEGEHHALPWKNYIFRMINFVLFLGILIYAAGGKIKAFFAGRRGQIKGDLDSLQARQADAEKKLQQVEKSIVNLTQEKKAILEEAEQQGQALREAIIEKAKQDAEVIKEQAKRTAANEAKGALDDMRAEVAELVVAAAERIVREKLSDAEHEKLVDEYLTKVVLN